MGQRSGFGILLVVLILLAGLIFVVPMLGMTTWGPMMMGGWACPIGSGWGYPTGMGWGFMFAGMLAPLVFIVLLILGAYFLLTSRGEPAGNEGALRILDERYARGEITKEQYQEMRKHIAGK